MIFRRLDIAGNINLAFARVVARVVAAVELIGCEPSKSTSPWVSDAHRRAGPSSA